MIPRLAETLKRAAAWLWQPGQKLSEKAIKGGVWLLIGRVVARGADLIRLIAMAHLLSRDAFGEFAVAVLASTWVEGITETGFQSAMVQKAKKDPRDLDTAWSFGLLRGMALTLLLILLAPYISQFFERESLTPMLRVISLSFVLRSLANPAVAYLRKEMHFREIVILGSIPPYVALVVGLTLAYFWRSAWALILSMLAARATRALASHWLCPERPGLAWKRDSLRQLVSFGKWVWANNILTVVLLQLDSAVIGKLIGLPALGVYLMANRLSQTMIVELGNIQRTVAFPALVSVSGDPARTRSVYLRMFRWTFYGNGAFSLLVWLASQTLLPFLLSADWAPALSLVGILALAGFSRALQLLGGGFLYALGVPAWRFWMTLVRLVVLLALVFPASSRWGLEGVCLAVLAAALAGFVPYLVAVRSAAGLGLLDHLAALVRRTN